VVNPIFVEERGESVQYGAIIWESMDLLKIFHEMIIPKSFTDGKYPFIQVRMPEFPQEDDAVSSGGSALYPVVNSAFRATVPDKEFAEAAPFDETPETPE